MTLDLKRISGQNLGTFSIHRKCNGAPLFVDINLLISGFNEALAGALERAVFVQEPVVVSVRQSIEGSALPGGLGVEA